MTTDLPSLDPRRRDLLEHRIPVLQIIRKTILESMIKEKAYLVGHNVSGMARDNMPPTELEQPVTPVVPWGRSQTAAFPWEGMLD